MAHVVVAVVIAVVVAAVGRCRSLAGLAGLFAFPLSAAPTPHPTTPPQRVLSVTPLLIRVTRSMKLLPPLDHKVLSLKSGIASLAAKR